MNRSSPLRRRVRMGQASRRRIQAGGKLATGRKSLSRASWKVLSAKILAKNEGWCPSCGVGKRATEVHHIIKRSQGGPDEEWNLIGLCHRCHEQTDRPFAKGRLVIDGAWPGSSMHVLTVVWAPDKFAARQLGALEP